MNKVYHVELKQPIKKLQKHSYYGSLSAIFDSFTPEHLGVKLTSLWSNHDFDKEPYENDICIIRLGELKRKKTNRGKNGNINNSHTTEA